MIYDEAAFYDEQYRHYRDDLSFYTRLADDYGSPVLELGAGTARVSAALARAGHKVVGIELSDGMLALAQKRLKDEKLEHLVDLEQGDIRTFAFPQKYNLIIAPFNVLMHLYSLNDQDAALACIKNHLAKDGVFAFDLYNPNFSELNRLRLEHEWEHVGGERSELFVYQRHEPEKQLLHSRYYLDIVNLEGRLARKTINLTQRYYTRFELERALQQAGFSRLQFFGSFDKGRYHAEAPQLMGLARF